MPNATVQAGGSCGPQEHASRPDAKPNTTIIVRWRGARGQTRPSSMRALWLWSVRSENVRPIGLEDAEARHFTCSLLVCSAARARMEGDAARSRALRHQSPVRAPRATPSPKNISFPRWIHLPAKVSRSSVLLSVGSLVPARASSPQRCRLRRASVGGGGWGWGAGRQ